MQLLIAFVAFAASPLRRLAIPLLAASALFLPASAQEPTVDSAATIELQPGWPVLVGRDTVAVIRARLGPFTAAERARASSQRLKRVASDPAFRPEQIRVVAIDSTADVVAGDLVLMSVTAADATLAGRSARELAVANAAAIQAAIRDDSTSARLRAIVSGALFALLTAIATVVVFRLVQRLFGRAMLAVARGRKTWSRALKIQDFVLLGPGRLAEALLWALKLIRTLTMAMLLYIAIPLILSFFPWTRRYSSQLFGYILTPFAGVWSAFIAFVPDLFTIGAIVVVTYYLLKLVRLVFTAISQGNLSFTGFYPEWGMPTYKLVRTLILAFAFVAVWPYLPGSDSPAFQGVGVMLGLLLSLGSAAAVGNVVGGVVLTYMRPFKVGDRVRISDTEGDVIEKTLLVTRIRTTKNVEITVPNAMVLGSHIINYSARSESRELLLHTTVSIGYDVPWRQVHELLIAAARETPGILADPAPFVLQTSLDDFYVSYQLNAHTDRPGEMNATYSALHGAIQDRFNEAGVEILSPHYRFVRSDGGDGG